MLEVRKLITMFTKIVQKAHYDYKKYLYLNFE